MSIVKTETDLSELKINYLTQAMYDDALENDEINENELYFTPDSGSGGSGTSVPTANTTAMFDAAAHMNSEDMSAQDVSDFVDSLNVSGGVIPQVTTFTPTKGSSYASWGGCYYERLGHIVHLHLAVSGLTTNTGNVVYALPSDIRPKTSDLFGWGSSGSTTQLCHIIISKSNGKVTAYPQGGTYCGVDIMYFI